MAPESYMHGHSFGRKVELVIGTSSVRLGSNFPEIPESVSDLIRKVIVRILLRHNRENFFTTNQHNKTKKRSRVLRRDPVTFHTRCVIGE